VDLDLCQLNALGVLAGDENLGGIPAMSVGRAIPVHLREGRREVDGGVGRGLNQLDILSVTATHDLVERQLKLDSINNSPQLGSLLANEKSEGNVFEDGSSILSRPEQEIEGTYKLVNVDENTGLGVFGGQDVTVDGNPPALVATQLSIAVEAIDERGELGAE
jgi:hypothetical protein